jgi:hypothetical protein
MSSLTERRDFDRQVTLSEAAHHDANVRSNDLFVAAMARATIRKKEKAVPGTFVDKSPPLNARRIRGDASLSACGSPAALCTETGARGDNGQTLR